jgi:uncharacterized membrane protein
MQPDTALDRLVFFSDGVFAIAITLLALDLRLPALSAPVTSQVLAHALARQAPRFLTFFISFEVIGIFWLVHHRLFSLIGRFDRALAVLNLLFLLCIVTLPFSTTLIGEYGTLTPAAVFYAGNLVAASLTSGLVFTYAARGGRLIRPDTDAADIHAFRARAVITSLLFVLSMLLAIVSPAIAQLSWIAVAIVAPLGERAARRRAMRRKR